MEFIINYYNALDAFTGKWMELVIILHIALVFMVLRLIYPQQVRIIKREFNNRTTWVIQQKHFLFRFFWVDAWINSSAGAACVDSFSTEEEARASLCLFDGTRSVETPVQI